MDKMKAALMPEPGKIEFVERDVPDIDAEEVLVKIEHVGLCGSDVHYYEHGRIGDFVVEDPIVLGHEAAGKIVKTGKNVEGLKEGDLVALEPGIPCGKCEYCKSGKYNLCPDVVFMATPPVDGAFVEYVKYPVEVNNGWVAAEVHHEGYHIDLNGEIYVNEVDCHEACAAHNLQYWTQEQVEVIISTSMKNSITMRDPLSSAADVMNTLLAKGINFESLDKAAQNTIENVFYDTFKSLHREASRSNMSLAILRYRWNNVFETITSHVAQSEREQVLIDELYGLMKP